MTFIIPNPAVAQGILSQISGTLKPGGILGVLDHEGTSGADNATLHRIAYDEAVKAILAIWPGIGRFQRTIRQSC